MDNTGSKSVHDPVMGQQVGPSRQEVPVERNVITKWQEFKRTQTKVFDLYFIDLSEREDEAIRLTESNELEIDVETDRTSILQTIVLDRHLFKDVGLLNNNEAIAKLTKDAIMEMLENPTNSRTQNFFRDCYLSRVYLMIPNH